MRIVSGRWRGRALEAPRGQDVTRPTTDRTREAAASMVGAAIGLDLADVRVLDAFAGSGAMGLELLSRGAASLCLMERSRSSARAIRHNMDALGVDPDRCRLLVGDARTLAAREGTGPFDVVILDPPYALDPALSEEVLTVLREAGNLAPGWVALHERALDAEPVSLPWLETVRERRHGQSVLSLLEAVSREDAESRRCS